MNDIKPKDYTHPCTCHGISRRRQRQQTRTSTEMKLYHHTSFRLLLFIWLHFRHGRNISCVLLCVLSAINMMMIFFCGWEPSQKWTNRNRARQDTNTLRTHIVLVYIRCEHVVCIAPFLNTHLGTACAAPVKRTKRMGCRFFMGPDPTPSHVLRWCGATRPSGRRVAHISHLDCRGGEGFKSHITHWLSLCNSGVYVFEWGFFRRLRVCVCVFAFVEMCGFGGYIAVRGGCSQVRTWLRAVEVLWLIGKCGKRCVCVWVTNVHQSQLVIYSETLFGTMPFKFRVHIIYADMGLFCWKLSAWNVCEWYKSIRMIYV